MSFDNIAIIGAGISGLSLALLLHNKEFKVSIYELRPPDVVYDGAISLAPNGLKSLDALGTGVANRICSKGSRFRNLTFRNANHDLLDSYEAGNEEKYGFDAFRTYRQLILDDLKVLVKEAGISVYYNRKFSRVVSDSSLEGVTFEFADGSQETCSLLIGADGIHSRVRKHFLPNINPSWMGALALSGIAPTDKIPFPSQGYKEHLPVSIHGPTGAVHLAPQNPDDSEIVVAVQYRTHERDRRGWEAFNADKEGLREIAKGIATMNDITKTGVEIASLESFTIWPFYTIPPLPAWFSASGNVLIVGDSAHAIPPTGGQGANQALEDVHMLSLLIEAARDKPGVDWKSALQWWQQVRQERVSNVVKIADEIRKRRLPGWTGEGAEAIDSSWLFNVDIPNLVQGWLSKETGKS